MTSAAERRLLDAIADAVDLCRSPDGEQVAPAVVHALAAGGWVILRAESVRRAQERQRIAETRAEYADDQARLSDRWARESLQAERCIGDRCTFLYGEARARGATDDDLRGPG